MAFEVWPTVTVPIRMVPDTYDEQLERWVDSFQPEQGDPIEGEAASFKSDLVSWDQFNTWAEFSALTTFYRTTLQSGIKAFTLTNPFSGVALQVFKFVQLPKATSAFSRQTVTTPTLQGLLTYRIPIRLRRIN